MRVRRKKNTSKRLSLCGELIIAEPKEYKGKWHNIFGNTHPVHLEIGCGKGDFVCGMAQKYPDVNFVAMEKIADVAVSAVEKVCAAEIHNIRFIIGDAENLCDYFAPAEISAVYLNFSDPWKKRYQHNKRLTYTIFLDLYKKILPKGQRVYFKTDNTDLFEFSVKSFTANGFVIENLTDDLHAGEFAAENVMTEYEKNFVSQGVKIHRLEAIVP